MNHGRRGRYRTAETIIVSRPRGVQCTSVLARVLRGRELVASIVNTALQYTISFINVYIYDTVV